MKRRLDFRTLADWQDFARSPKRLKRSELKAAARDLARISGRPADEVIAMAMTMREIAMAMTMRDAITLAEEPARPPSPSHVPGNPFSGSCVESALCAPAERHD